jgi:excisionase family DNA binding protein
MASLLSPAEVATYLRIPIKTLYNWRSAGAGPPGIRVGRHVRYRQADVDLWLDQQTDRRSRGDLAERIRGRAG